MYTGGKGNGQNRPWLALFISKSGTIVSETSSIVLLAFMAYISMAQNMLKMSKDALPGD